MTFAQTMLECVRAPGFVEEYDRLTGSSLDKLSSRSGLERMIDESTGYENAQVARFAAFVYEVVWTRLPRPERPGDA